MTLLTREATSDSYRQTDNGIYVRKEFDLKPIRKEAENPLLYQYLPRWMSNDSPFDLGVIRFGFDLFPEALKKEYGVAGWVRPALYQVLAYHPEHTKIDRSHAICTYREGSKSTWFTKILPLYFLLVGQYGVYHKDYLLPEMDYIRIRAKNEDDATKKLDRVLMEFTNPNVLKLFGRLEPTLKETKDKRLKNTSKFIILLNGYILQALGLNQPARGANIKDLRPKFDIDDDVENKENTKTETQRTYNGNEILGEQFGGLDKDGITVYIGNYVHSECIMRNLQDEDNTSWTKQFHTATYIDEETQQEVSDWPSRFSVEYWHKLEQWYEKQPKLGGRRTFFMEYYNKLISDKDYQVLYFEGRYEHRYGVNWIVINKNVEGQPSEEWINCFIVVSLDPAISTTTKSSDGCVTVTAFCSDEKRRVIDLSLAKFDIRDRYHDSAIEDRIKSTKRLAITAEDLYHVYRKGGVEETARKILKYHADAFVIENAGQQLAWYNDLQDLLKKMGISIPGLPYHPTDDKDYKLQTGLLNFFADSAYYILANLPFRANLVNQIQTFPDNKKDILDALHNGEKIGRIPLKVSPSLYGAVYIVSEDTQKKKELDKLLEQKDVEPYAVLPY